jgi:16S rRNA (cytidine1402-2'-O)-methyltransferase
MDNHENIPVLYLIPSHLGEGSPPGMLPAVIAETISGLRYFVAEDLRTARRFLKSVDRKTDIDSLHFSLLNEHTKPEEIPGLLKPLKEGADLGLLSEAGLPCIADPGAQLVKLAHQAGFRVKPLPGPSSIYLALMASGFNGQNFVFHGYLPVDKQQRAMKIREIESDMLKNDRTQVFIEAPYRNNQLLSGLLKTCRDTTLLCIASDLTTKREKITVKPVGQWKGNEPDLHKVPAVFLLYY